MWINRNEFIVFTRSMSLVASLEKSSTSFTSTLWMRSCNCTFSTTLSIQLAIMTMNIDGVSLSTVDYSVCIELIHAIQFSKKASRKSGRLSGAENKATSSRKVGMREMRTYHKIWLLYMFHL